MSNIRLVHGSCADQEVDAIVNAANRNLFAGTGICGVIFNKAGYEKLTEACSMINTPLDDGDAVITPAFDFKNAKYIIHAVGPDFSVTPDAFDKLFLAYYNSMVVLQKNGLHSISFPLISSGIYSGSIENPAYESSKRCLDAYREFKENFDYEIDVILCAYAEEEYNEANKVFSKGE